MLCTLSDIAKLIGAELRGADARISGVAPLDEAGPDQLSLCLNARHAGDLSLSKAIGVIVPKRATHLAELAPAAVLLVDDPRLALVKILNHLHPPAPVVAGIQPGTHIDNGAVIDASARIESGAQIQARARIGARSLVDSGAVVGAGGVVGSDCVIGANAVIGADCCLGDRVVIHPGVVIGSAGFGFVTIAGKHQQMPQVGNVEISDDVEIGANSTVDRATLGSTRIGNGTKIDNQVQVAHNVQIGNQVLIAAQVGISGSAKIGDNVVIGGQAGVADGVLIGAGAQVAAQSGVGTTVAPGAKIAGSPAIPLERWLEGVYIWRRLGKIIARLRGQEGLR